MKNAERHKKLENKEIIRFLACRKKRRGHWEK